MSVEVSLVSNDSETPTTGIGLCLSGGGYRAMVFHIGALWRLYEAEILKGLSRVSSVSGGSITAAQLALSWDQLSFEGVKAREDFVPKIVTPLRYLAGKTIDRKAIGGGVFLPGSASEYVEKAYKKHLLGDKTLQDITGGDNKPRFIFNATSLQSGALVRFSKPYMWDYRVGKIPNPTIPLARVVAASSAFPPVLSPCDLEFEPNEFEPNTGKDLQFEPYTTQMYLTDGGVYDNLGLETVWKNCATVFVSNGGGKMAADEEPETGWARQSKRVLDVIDNQVRSLRARQLVESYEAKTRKGAYWGARTNIADYKLPIRGSKSPMDVSFRRSMELAELPTRLKRMPDMTQERLINGGYAVCDAAIRKYYDDKIPKGSFPYPEVGV